MPNIPGMFNQLPGYDPIFAEVNIISEGYYEVGGISEQELVDGYYRGTSVYYQKPHFTGSLKKIARDMFSLWVKEEPTFRHKQRYAWPLMVTFHPKLEVKFSPAAIPTSRDQNTDLNKFLADITVEFDKLRVFLPFL